MRNYKIRVFFGSPGCGKSTLAVRECYRHVKKLGYKHSYANFEIKPKYGLTCDLTGLGKWSFPEDSYVAIDEAGIEYNNRNYKSFPQYTIKWFKKHRHHRCSVDVFSQSWDDMDVTLRRLATEYWYMRRITPWFTFVRRVYKRVRVDKNTEQIIDGYRMVSFIWLFLKPLQYLPLFKTYFPSLRDWQIIFLPRWWHGHDSWSVDPDIEIKEYF